MHLTSHDAFFHVWRQILALGSHTIPRDRLQTIDEFKTQADESGSKSMDLGKRQDVGQTDAVYTTTAD